MKVITVYEVLIQLYDHSRGFSLRCWWNILCYCGRCFYHFDQPIYIKECRINIRNTSLYKLNTVQQRRRLHAPKQSHSLTRLKQFQHKLNIRTFMKEDLTRDCLTRLGQIYLENPVNWHWMYNFLEVQWRFLHRTETQWPVEEFLLPNVRSTNCFWTRQKTLACFIFGRILVYKWELSNLNQLMSQRTVTLRLSPANIWSISHSLPFMAAWRTLTALGRPAKTLLLMKMNFFQPVSYNITLT